jgi:hypothetical protein
MPKGASVTLASGACLTFVSGSVQMETKGCVVNITTGKEVQSGVHLETGNRYFCAENTTAIYKAESDSRCLIDGYYLSSGAEKVADIFRFSDISPKDWFYDSVAFVCDRGLFNGTSETTFSPSLTMTRAMLVTVLWRLAGEPAPSSAAAGAFTDLKADWYRDSVAWAAENEIVSGYGGGIFAPDDMVTREQICLILFRYAEHMDYSVSVLSYSKFNSFADKGEVSSFAVDAVKWAAAKSIINGSSENGEIKLLPRSSATRAQVAQIMLNFCEYISGL